MRQLRYPLIAAAALLLPLAAGVGGGGLGLDAPEAVRGAREPAAAAAARAVHSSSELAAPAPGAGREPQRHDQAEGARPGVPLATPAGGEPGDTTPALEVDRVARRPSAPFVQTTGRQGEETLVRVIPTEPAGAIVVADGSGRVFGRHPLPRTFSASMRVVELAVIPAEGETSVRIAQERPDGSRSDWRPIATPMGGPR